HLFLRPRPPCSGKLACDLQAFRLPEFTEPLRFAAAALGAGLVVTVPWRAFKARRAASTKAPLHAKPLSPTDSPLAIAGVLFGACALAGYERTGHLVVGLSVAVVLLAAGGFLADVGRVPLLLRFVLALPGAFVLFGHSALPDPTWARAFAAGVAIVGSGLIADLDLRTAALGLGPVLLAVTTFGLYESEPDPDFALLLFGAALPLLLLGWPVVLARLGGAGAGAAAGFMAWAGAVGGRGLLSAVVAGGACLGLFAIEPLSRLVWLGRRSLFERLPRRYWVAPAIAAVQLGLAALSSRIAAFGRSPLEAGVMGGVGLAICVGLAFLLSSRRRVPAAGASPAGERPERGAPGR
ncbi:MAG: hypothetical protein ACRD0B_09610, partial [Acidimicrobiales bacterium]